MAPAPQPSGSADWSEDRWITERKAHLSLFTNCTIVNSLYYAGLGIYLDGLSLTVLHTLSILGMLTAKGLSLRYPTKPWASIIFLFTLNGLLLTTSMVDGMLSAPGLWLVGLVPMATSILLSFRATLFAAAATFIDVFLIAHLQGFAEAWRAVPSSQSSFLTLLVTNVWLFVVVGYVAGKSSWRKINTLKYQRRLMRQANEESTRAFEDKTRFLAKMSHEIRTPLNGLLGSAQVLQTLNLGQAQMERVFCMHAGAENLLVALNLCLDGAQEQDTVVSALSPPACTHSLATCLREIATRFQSHPKLSLCQVEIDPQLDRSPCGVNQEHLTRCVSNMLRELTQEPGADSVVLSAQLVKGPDGAPEFVDLHLNTDQSNLNLAISKAANHQDLESSQKLCESWAEDEHEAARSLAREVTIHMVEAMQASVLMRSDEANSRLHGLRLPFYPLAPSPQEVAQRAKPPTSTRVLLVDDNPINLKVGSRLLEHLSCQVSQATDGLLAVELAAKRPFDIIFMDVRMPNMCGLQATRKIQRDCELNRHTPIVALTANAYASDKASCLEAGMVAHLAKPVRASELQDMIQRYVPSKAPSSKPEPLCA